MNKMWHYSSNKAVFFRVFLLSLCISVGSIVPEEEAVFGASVAKTITSTLAGDISSESETTTTAVPTDNFVELPESVHRTCISTCGLTKVVLSDDILKVIGGGPASAGEFPWFGAITRFQHNKQPRWRVVCGSALINAEYAITAAHCLHNRYKDTLEVVFNLRDAHSIDNDTSVVRRKLKRFVLHPDYNPNNQHNDIALVQFKQPIDLTKMTEQAPICLPPISSKNTYAGISAVFAGFGHTAYGSSDSDKPKENSRVLMKVRVPVISHENCLRSKVPSKKNITESMLCAGSHGKDACINDSGGPLMVQENGKMTLVGLASWGVGCGLQDYPGVYTRVTKYLSWIRDASSTMSTSCV